MCLAERMYYPSGRNDTVIYSLFDEAAAHPTSCDFFLFMAPLCWLLYEFHHPYVCPSHSGENNNAGTLGTNVH